MSYILQLDTIDVSDYVENGYNVQTEPVYDSNGYTNMLGQDKTELLGYKVSLSANLGEVPAELAKSILTVCNNSTVTASYATPVEGTAVFKRPSITSELTSENNGGVWDISLSMETDTILLDSL